jgi:HEAT repeat protein
VAKHSDAALDMVVSLLKSEKWLVRTAAAEALGLAERATPEVVVALIRVLKRATTQMHCTQGEPDVGKD